MMSHIHSIPCAAVVRIVLSVVVTDREDVIIAKDEESTVDQKKEFPIIHGQNDDSLVVTKGSSKVKWSDAVGQSVVAEGIAWTTSKGFGDRVILDGTTVYVQLKKGFGKNFGKLVRVEGVLEKVYHEAGPPLSQTHSDVYYYTIAGAKWTEIDRVRSPYLILGTRDP